MASYGLYRFFIEGIRIDPLYLFDTDIKLSRLIALISAVFFGAMLILITILRSKDKKLFMKALMDEDDLSVGKSDYKDLLKDKDTYIPEEENEVKIDSDEKLNEDDTIKIAKDEAVDK
jgi:hypothetical protein